MPEEFATAAGMSAFIPGNLTTPRVQQIVEEMRSIAGLYSQSDEIEALLRQRDSMQDCLGSFAARAASLSAVEVQDCAHAALHARDPVYEASGAGTRFARPFNLTAGRIEAIIDMMQSGLDLDAQARAVSTLLRQREQMQRCLKSLACTAVALSATDVFDRASEGLGLKQGMSRSAIATLPPP